VAAGCGRPPAPGPGSGSAVRARFLDSFAKPEAASRGAGAVSLRRGEVREGSMQVRWATEQESIVVVGFVGPVRALDATFLGDSLFVALRPMDLGVSGRVLREEGLGPGGLRFLARPWDFSPMWIRAAVERGKVEPKGDGWRVTGIFRTERANPFQLELNASGEPSLLNIGRPSSRGTLVTVHYGNPKKYQGGSVPRWIEWRRGPSIVRLDIDTYTRPKPSRLRHPPPAEPEWTMLTLGDSRSRALLLRFLGIGAENDRP
jgi:hypothetical protein